MNLRELLACEATVEVEHRGQKLEITCRPEIVTPDFKRRLVEASEAPLVDEQKKASSKKGKGDQEPAAAPAAKRYDGDTEMILQAATGWNMRDGETPVELNGDTLEGLSYGLRFAIVRAITFEAQNPTSASA